jgi:hypothetical protein
MAICGPLNPPHQGTKLSRDSIDRHFQATASVFESAAVLDRQIDQWHSLLLRRSVVTWAEHDGMSLHAPSAER